MKTIHPLSYFEEKQVSSELIFDGTLLHVYRDGITLPNGQPTNREYVRHVGVVCILPLTEDGKVICVKQYRYPFADVILELPAGKMDPDETNPEDAARRELREETGANCEKLTYLGEFYGSPAIIDERVHMYIAEGLTFGETDPDEDEFIESAQIPFDELVDMVMRGEVPDGKSQCTILRAAMLNRA